MLWQWVGCHKIKERTEYKLTTMCHQSLHNDNYPEYLGMSIQTQRFPRTCNDDGPKVKLEGHKNSFSSRSGNLFNELPKAIREIKNENLFKNRIRKLFIEKVSVRTF